MGYSGCRVKCLDPPIDVRDRIVTEAHAAGFNDILLVNLDMVF
ncbi:MAG TPA: hypothetical protein VLM40_23160 [Gemmata sp.]|nr:hypothetical protein [Gemmata sp.]